MKRVHTLLIEGEKNAGENYMEIKNELGEMLFYVNKIGVIFNPTTNSLQLQINEIRDHKEVHEDDSVYIGSLKFSYNRVQRKMEIKTLTQNHIPTVLSDASFTTAEGKGIDDMHFGDWREIARTYLSDDDLTMKQLFPLNSGPDWEVTQSNILESTESDIVDLETALLQPS